MKVKERWKRTAGYKTKTGAILYLLFQLFQKLFPDTITEENEELIKYTIDLLILTGGIDWVWRNRKEVLKWIVGIFKKKNKCNL
jgi:hypothetical protein